MPISHDVSDGLAQAHKECHHKRIAHFLSLLIRSSILDAYVQSHELRPTPWVRPGFVGWVLFPAVFIDDDSVTHVRRTILHNRPPKLEYPLTY